MSYQPRIVSVARRGDPEPLFPRLDAVYRTASGRALLRRAIAEREDRQAEILANQRRRSAATVAEIERRMILSARLRADPAVSASRSRASALATAASVALVIASVALALWLGGAL